MAATAHMGLASTDLVTLYRAVSLHATACCGFNYMGAAMLLLCLLTLRYRLEKYCLLKDCTESTARNTLRVMKISSGRDKLKLLLLTQAVGESFVIHFTRNAAFV